MSALLVAPTGTTVSAHPTTGHPHVDVPIVLVAVGAAMLVALIAVMVPVREPWPPEPDAAGTASWAGRLSWPQWTVRACAVLLLALVVVAGRFGADEELDNLAPALVVGAGLPLLVLGSLVVGRLWRWLDPWDTVARLLTPGEESSPPGHVWPAVVVVLPWLWLLSVHSRPLDPRVIGTTLAAYTVVTLAGCVALGRAYWLGSGEPLGLVLSWLGLVPRRRLADWEPPRGAGVLLGVLAGGLLFGLLRRTELWVPVLSDPRATVWSTLGFLVACATGAALATLAGRVGSDPPRRALVARALALALAGVVIAVSLARNRLFNSVQLLPGLVGDPLGRGWDLLGSPTENLVVAPLGATGLVALQIAVVVAAHAAAAAIVPRPYIGDERLPAIAILAASVLVGVTAVSLH